MFPLTVLVSAVPLCNLSLLAVALSGFTAIAVDADSVIGAAINSLPLSPFCFQG